MEVREWAARSPDDRLMCGTRVGQAQSRVKR